MSSVDVVLCQVLSSEKHKEMRGDDSEWFYQEQTYIYFVIDLLSSLECLQLVTKSEMKIKLITTKSALVNLSNLKTGVVTDFELRYINISTLH